MPLSGVGRLAREQLIKNQAEGKDIARRGYGLAPELLRAHVVQSPQDLPGTRWGRSFKGRLGREPEASPRSLGAGLFESGDSKIEELEAPALHHHDVGGLDIPVHDAGIVNGGQRLRELKSHVQRLRRIDGSGDLSGERAAGYQLEDQSRQLRSDQNIVESADSGMVELGKQPGLAAQATRQTRIGGGFPVQDLEGDLSSEPSVDTPIDAAHTAPPQDLLEAEIAQAFAGEVPFPPSAFESPERSAVKVADEAVTLGLKE
ncbi:MAG: hypothetical protein AAF725_21210 [Acidobacteriota bacterium]